MGSSGSPSPNLFIVGAPKSGTSALSDFLAQHPEVFMTPIKEPLFFASDFYSPYKVRDLSSYLDYFKSAGAEALIGEASTRYLMSDVAAENIRSFCEHAKIIVMLREPVELMYSLHSQLLWGGREDLQSFEDALRAEDDRKLGLRVPPNSYPIAGLFYRETVNYAPQVRRYFDAFGRDNVHVIIHDDFQFDNLGVYRDVCRYLGIDTSFVPVVATVNPNKAARSAILSRLLRPRSVLLRRVGRTVAPKRLVRSIRRLNTVHVERQSMPQALREQLRLEVRPQIEDLSELLGRDLSGWLTPVDTGRPK